LKSFDTSSFNSGAKGDVWHPSAKSQTHRLFRASATYALLVCFFPFV
jgi:hypothetical protein